MKIRTGFVSNSSSSSFVCEVCGDVEAGIDMWRSEAGMEQCRNGHTFCTSHMLKALEEPTLKYKIETLKSSIWYKDNVDYDDENDIEETFDEMISDEGIDALYCPICTLENISSEHVLAYLKAKNNMSIDEIKAEIQEKFKNNQELLKFIGKE